MTSLQRLLAPLRTELLGHPLYFQINSLPALHVFMQHHVFAVWDFMSLLKTLQRRLGCIEVPWLPPTDPLAARFINEIVLGEESDDDGQGGFASHFDLYHRSMSRCGADTRCIDTFLSEVRRGRPVKAALDSAHAPAAVCEFVGHTFDLVEGGDLCAIASAFTYGREDLLPGLFQRIIDELNVEAHGGLDEFKYYLNRHIELDGDEHGPMAGKLIERLCGGDPVKLRNAEQAAVTSLQARQKLWNGMLAAIVELPKPASH